jgi:hypothetical protein
MHSRARLAVNVTYSCNSCRECYEDSFLVLASHFLPFLTLAVAAVKYNHMQRDELDACWN